MKRFAILIVLAILLAVPFIAPGATAQAQSELPVVRAVIFYSPTCGHCQMVINDTLLPMVERYGEQLQIIGLDVTQPQPQQVFLAAMQKFGLERGAVPMLVIDNIHLVGSVDIPERFPGLVEMYLQNGGVDWPDIPGLMNFLPTPPESAPLPTTPEPGSVSPASPAAEQDPAFALSHAEAPNWRERFAHDPAGNTLSVVVLAAMLGASFWGYSLFRKTKDAPLKDKWSWLIPLLCMIGAGVAGYLAYVETAQVEAVCGPVGDCNTVQQSEYARLFGILPIGVMGLIGYAAILGSWGVAHFTVGRLADLAPLAILGMTIFGTLFSIYLTFLEPFVIGATCAWCLTSAILMTVLMLLSVAPAQHALRKHKLSDKP